MPLLIEILIATTLGSIISLAGGFLLVFKESLARNLAGRLSAFAAGALLGTAFIDLLPEAVEEAAHPETIFLWALAGILIFFLLERTIHWFHHHHEHEGEVPISAAPLIILGDTLHNFLDGVAIALTFMLDPALGVITTIAIGAHEIPQEIGDFGLLLKAGYSRKKVIFYNVISATAALLGAVTTYAIGPQLISVLPALLALTAGFFIYIATSDIIPTIHASKEKQHATAESVLLIAGVVVVGVLVTLLGAH